MLADRGVLQLDVVSDAGECESRRDVARKLMSRLQVTGGADQSMLTVMLAVWERRSVGPPVARAKGLASYHDKVQATTGCTAGLNRKVLPYMAQATTRGKV